MVWIAKNRGFRMGVYGVKRGLLRTGFFHFAGRENFRKNFLIFFL